MIRNIFQCSPGWCVSVGWASSCKPKRKITGSIPSQRTCLGCRFGPSQGAYGRQRICFSLPLFLSSSPCLKKKQSFNVVFIFPFLHVLWHLFYLLIYFISVLYYIYLCPHHLCHYLCHIYFITSLIN